MGVTGLNDLIDSSLVSQQSIRSFQGKRIAVDMMNWLYAAAYQVRKELLQEQTIDWRTLEIPKPLFREELLLYFLEYNAKLHGHGWHCIWVFDGPRRSAKAHVEVNRDKVRSSQREEIKQLREQLSTSALVNPQQLARLKMLVTNFSEFTPLDIVDLKNCMKTLGFAWAQACDEGERAAAWLVRRQFADACLTNDTDAYVYGCPVTIRKFTSNTTIEVVYLEPFLNKLNLDQSQLVDLAIIAGCDYTGGLNKIGPKKGLKLLQKHQRIEQLPAQYQSQIDLLPVSYCRELLTTLCTEEEVISEKNTNARPFKCFQSNLTAWSEWLAEHDITTSKIHTYYHVYK